MRKYNKKGYATTLLIVAAWMFAMMFLMLGFSRLSLSIDRGATAYDKVVSSYDTESTLNDELARLVGSYPELSTTNYNLTNKTRISIKADSSYATVSGMRNWASTKMHIKKFDPMIPGGANGIDLVFVMDCSDNMSRDACIDGSCPGKTRMMAWKEALLSMLGKIKALPYANKVHIGISLYSLWSEWMRTTSGVEIRPENTVAIDDIIDAVTTKLHRDGGYNGADLSPACVGYLTGWGPGAGLMNSQRSLAATKPTGRKQVEVLFTDSRIDTSIPQPEMPGMEFCPASLCGALCCPAGVNCGLVNALNGNKNWPCTADVYSNCYFWARDNVKYSAMKTNQSFVPSRLSGNRNGLQDTDIEFYPIIADTPMALDIEAVYKSSSKKYYGLPDAKNLVATMDDLYNQIFTSTTGSLVLTIEPVMP